MATNNAVGMSIGLPPGENGPTLVRVVLDFTTRQSQRYEALAGDGSARSRYGYQAAFIDNGKNPDPLQVTCDGTLLSYTVPARHQAFLPIACPPGMLGITFDVPNMGAVVVVDLLDTPVPYVVWPVAGFGGSGSAADTATTDGALVQEDGATSSAAGTWTLLMGADATRKGASIQNRSAGPLYVAQSVAAPGAGVLGVKIPADPVYFRFDFVPRKSYWIRADAASAAYHLDRW